MAALVHIFPLTSPWCQETSKQSDSPNSQNIVDKLSGQNYPFIVFGDEEIGKTTLLFQAAVSYAAKDSNVLYICHQPLTRMPLGIHGMPHPDAHVLKNVKFMYFKNTDEVIDYCSSVHMKTVLPDVIIIDNLDFYIDQIKEDGTEHGTARLCALLVDTVSYIKSKSDSNQCQLLLSCNDKQKNLHHVFRKFRFSVATLHGHSSENIMKLEFKSRNIDITISYRIDPSGLYFISAEMAE